MCSFTKEKHRLFYFIQLTLIMLNNFKALHNMSLIKMEIQTRLPDLYCKVIGINFFLIFAVPVCKIISVKILCCSM